MQILIRTHTHTYAEIGIIDGIMYIKVPLFQYTRFYNTSLSLILSCSLSLSLSFYHPLHSQSTIEMSSFNEDFSFIFVVANFSVILLLLFCCYCCCYFHRQLNNSNSFLLWRLPCLACYCFCF